jgi:subtilisin family serine protease
VFKDVSGVGTTIYIAEARILPNERQCLKEITPQSGCIGTVCNPDIDGITTMSTAVPLYGFGPLQAEVAEVATSLGIIPEISIIAKLKPGTTHADVARLCATLQGMDEGSAPSDVFARGLAMRGAGPDAPGLAACQVEPTDALVSLDADGASSEVEWPLLNVVVNSYDTIGEVRDVSVDYVSYYDKDGVAYASGRPRMGSSPVDIVDGIDEDSTSMMDLEAAMEVMTSARAEAAGGVMDGAWDETAHSVAVSKKSSIVFVDQERMAEQADVIDSAAAPAGCPGVPWGLSRLDQANLPLDGVYNSGYLSGKGVHVYVLDTGLNMHSDFESRLGEGVDCTSGSCRSSSFSDGTGHGTHVAGTIAGTCYGVAKGAIIHPVKVLGANGSGSYSSIISGIKWATDHARRNGWRGVINMSLGGGASSSLDSATNTAVSQGMVVAVAAGNESGADACTKSPARASNALTTGATTKSDRWASFSNVGRCLDIWAPGSRVASANYQNYYGYSFKDGTSMASPHVAGAAALYLEKYPSASPAQVRDGLLKASVRRNIYSGSTTALLQTLNYK